MKKISYFLLMVAILFCSIAFGFACNKEPDSTEEHHFATEWTSDKTSHWKACKDSDCEEISEKANHKPGSPEEEIIKQATSSEKGQKKIITKCSVCGYIISSKIEETGFLTCCDSFDEIVDEKFLKEPATKENPIAVFYKSCEHGLAGEETFQMPVDVTDVPKSVMLSMFDTKANGLKYGVNWINYKHPLIPKIKYKKTTDSEFTFVDVSIEEYQVSNDKTYYSCKAVIELEKGASYEYYITDKATTWETEKVEFTAVNPQAESFKFAMFSDTQDQSNIGVAFGNVLANISNDVEFYIHGGDVVENTKANAETEWLKMVGGENAQYLNKPMMAVSGNHDTDTQWYSAPSAFYNHFNFNMPKQDTSKGVYYSYIYGNTKFIVLNTNDVYLDKEAENYACLKEDQIEWLQSELENKTWTWTIVTMHSPIYSVGAWGADTTNNKNLGSLTRRAQLNSIFVEGGVDLVIQAHDHVISKTNPLDKDGNTVLANKYLKNDVEYTFNPQGTIYTMNGTAGSETKTTFNYESEKYDFTANGFASTWAEYEITSTEIVVTIKYYDATAQDVKVFRKWAISKESKNLSIDGNADLMIDGESGTQAFSLYNNSEIVGSGVEWSVDKTDIASIENGVLTYTGCGLIKVGATYDGITVEKEVAVYHGISTLAELKSLSDSNPQGYYRLTADIDAENNDYFILAYNNIYFDGILDGNGHSIYNVARPIVRSLRGTLKNIAFINVTDTGTTVKSGSKLDCPVLGRVVNVTSGATIENVYIEANITAGGDVGILLGNLDARYKNNTYKPEDLEAKTYVRNVVIKVHNPLNKTIKTIAKKAEGTNTHNEVNNILVIEDGATLNAMFGGTTNKNVHKNYEAYKLADYKALETKPSVSDLEGTRFTLDADGVPCFKASGVQITSDFEDKTVTVGNTVTVEDVYVMYNGIKVVADFTCSSDNENVTIEGNVITGVAEGTSIITVTPVYSEVNGTPKTFTITVVDEVVELATEDAVDDLTTMELTVDGVAKTEGVTWSSSNEGVATIDANTGLVSRVATLGGKTTITATYNGKEYTKEITVYKGVSAWTDFVRNSTSGYYKLLNNITDGRTTNVPLVGDFDAPDNANKGIFNGVIDGNGYRIEGLTFPIVRNLYGTIKNLEVYLNDTTMTGKTYVTTGAGGRTVNGCVIDYGSNAVVENMYIRVTTVSTRAVYGLFFGGPTSCTIKNVVVDVVNTPPVGSSAEGSVFLVQYSNNSSLLTNLVFIKPSGELNGWDVRTCAGSYTNSGAYGGIRRDNTETNTNYATMVATGIFNETLQGLNQENYGRTNG